MLTNPNYHNKLHKEGKSHRIVMNSWSSENCRNTYWKKCSESWRHCSN